MPVDAVMPPVLLAVGAFLAYVVIRVLFSAGWLVHPCGRCEGMVLPGVNGIRYRDEDATAYLCDRCNREVHREHHAELTKEYAERAGDV